MLAFTLSRYYSVMLTVFPFLGVDGVKSRVLLANVHAKSFPGPIVGLALPPACPFILGIVPVWRVDVVGVGVGVVVGDVVGVVVGVGVGVVGVGVGLSR